MDATVIWSVRFLWATQRVKMFRCSFAVWGTQFHILTPVHMLKQFVAFPLPDAIHNLSFCWLFIISLTIGTFSSVSLLSEWIDDNHTVVKKKIHKRQSAFFEPLIRRFELVRPQSAGIMRTCLLSCTLHRVTLPQLPKQINLLCQHERVFLNYAQLT